MKPMSTRAKAILAIVIASIFWATSGITGKELLQHFDPFFVSLIRQLVASLCILPLFLKQPRYPIKKVMREVVPIASLVAWNMTFYYLGLRKTTVDASYILYAATPLLVSLVSAFTIKEYLSAKKMFGVVVGFIGVLSIFVLPGIGRGAPVFGTLTGNILIFIAVLGWATYTVGSSYLINTKGYSPFYVTYVSILTSTVIIAIVNLFVAHHIETDILLRPPIILTFLYLGLFITVAPYVLYQWAIKNTSSATASFTNYLQPVFAFYFSWIFLGEQITTAFLFGSILVLVGVFIATSEKTREYIRIFREKRRSREDS
jgi:drug/metabolite transporter (DMT)-like permease